MCRYINQRILQSKFNPEKLKIWQYNISASVILYMHYKLKSLFYKFKIGAKYQCPQTFKK